MMIESEHTRDEILAAGGEPSLEEVRRVLEPFATLCAYFDGEAGYAEYGDHVRVYYDVTHGDLRRAREMHARLARPTGGEGAGEPNCGDPTCPACGSVPPQPAPEQVERVARAIYDAHAHNYVLWDDLVEAARKHWRKCARAALAAGERAPEGWQHLRIFRCSDGWAIDDETTVPFQPIARCMSEQTAHLLANALASAPTAPSALLDAKDAENAELRAVIAWANNSLFGSHTFFLSLDGGPANEHHLDTAIEELKARARRTSRAEHRADTAERQLAEARADLKSALKSLKSALKNAERIVLAAAHEIERRVAEERERIVAILIDRTAIPFAASASPSEKSYVHGQIDALNAAVEAIRASLPAEPREPADG